MGLPAAVVLSPELQSKFRSTPAYGFAVVDKINTKEKKDRRFLIITSAFLFLVDSTKRNGVKRMWQWSDIGSITKGRNNDFLIKVKDGREPDQLLNFTSNVQSSPNNLEEFLNVMKMCSSPKLSKLTPPDSLKIEDLSADKPDLKSIANRGGAKVNAKDKRDRLINQFNEEAAQPPPPASSPASPPLDPYKLRDDDSDSDDLANNPTFNDKSVIKAPIAGSINRRSYSPTMPVSTHPRWIPGSWPEGRSEARTPPPEGSPWEMHFSNKTAKGRCYWYNTITGENTWSPPPEYEGSRSPSLPGARRSPPWVPPSASPRSGLKTPYQLRVPDELRAEMSPPMPPLEYNGSRSPSPADILQRAATLAGTDVGTLVVAANDITARRSMNYGGTPYQAIVV